CESQLAVRESLISLEAERFGKSVGCLIIFALTKKDVHQAIMRLPKFWPLGQRGPEFRNCLVESAVAGENIGEIIAGVCCVCGIRVRTQRGLIMLARLLEFSLRGKCIG